MRGKRTPRLRLTQCSPGRCIHGDCNLIDVSMAWTQTSWVIKVVNPLMKHRIK